MSKLTKLRNKVGRFLRGLARLLAHVLRRVNWRLALTLLGCIAAYVLLGRFLSPQVPFAGRLRFQYAVLAVAAVALGPLEGLAVGVLGQLLLGAASGVGPWWSEVAAVAIAGFGTGLLAHKTYDYMGGLYGRAVPRFWLAALAAFGVAFLVVCPALDMLLYRDALENLWRILFTAVANALAAIAGGTLLLKLYGRFDRRNVYYDDIGDGY